MAKKGRPKRAQVDVSIVCPWDKCKRKIKVKIFRDVVKKAVPAKVELIPVVEKDGQKTLFDEPPPQPKGKKAKTSKGRAPKKKKSVKGLKKKSAKKKKGGGRKK